MKYRHLRRTLIAVVAALAVLTLLITGVWRLLESDTVRHAAARRIEALAGSTMDVDLVIGDLGFQIVPPRIVVSDVSVDTDALKMRIGRAAVELGRLLIARRRVILDTVEARGVSIVLKDGRIEQRERDRAPVHVIIRHLDLAEIDIQGVEVPTGTVLGITGGKVSWLADGGSTRGILSVERIDAVVPGLEPIEVALSGAFELQPGWIEAHRLRLHGEGFDLTAAGRWDEDGVFARGDGHLDLGQLDHVVRAGARLGGRVTFDATVDTRAHSMVTGNVRADRVEAGGVGFEDVLVSLEAGMNEGLTAVLERARWAKGSLRGRYDLQKRGTALSHAIDAVGSGLDLASVLGSIEVPTGGMTGSADVTARLAWTGSEFWQGQGGASVDFQGGDGHLAVSGPLELQLEHGLLQFNADRLRLGSSILRFQGPLEVGSWTPQWSLRADPALLEEVLPAVNRWIGTPVFPDGLTGRGILDVGLSGPWKQLNVGVRLDMSPVVLDGVQFDRLVVDASVGGGACRIERGQFQIGSGGGSINGGIRWEAEAPSDQLDLQIEGRQIPLDRVADWVSLPAGLVSGEVAMTGGLRGAFDEMRGSWAVGLSGVSVGAVELGSGSATVNARGFEWSATGIEFDGGLAGQARWDVEERVVTGGFEWPDLDVQRVFEPLAHLVGRRADWMTSVRWSLDQSWPVGRMQLTGETAALAVDLDQGGLRGTVSMEGIGRAEAEAEFGEDWPAWSGRASVEIASVASMIDALAPGVRSGLSGTLTVPMELQGRGFELIRVDGEVEPGALNIGDRAVVLGGDRRFRWDANGFAMDGLHVNVGEDRVFLRGGLDPEGRLRGNLSGSFDAGWFRLFLREWEPAGRVTGTVEMLGRPEAPRFEGIARVDHGSFRIPGSRTVVRDIDGSVFLSQKEVTLEGLTFDFMRGRGRGRGHLVLDGTSTQLQLGGHIEDLDYPLFPGFVPRIEGAWALRGPVEDLELSGDLVVTRGEVRRQDDLPSLLLAWFGDVGPPRQDHLRLDLGIRADESLVSRSPFMRLVGSADLTLTGTDARPGLVGNIEFLEGGEVTLLGVRYELERGHISFSDPTRIDPMLDFQARANIREYNVWLSLTGTMDRLIPRVSSDPPLSPTEIFSLMSLGKIGQGEAGGSVGMTLASSLLSKKMNEVLGSRNQWLLPVDQIRVDPQIESTTGDPSARVTVVKQLSPNITVTLQSDLSGDAEETITARWYLSSGFFIEASHDTRNDDGTYGLDLKLRRRY